MPAPRIPDILIRTAQPAAEPGQSEAAPLPQAAAAQPVDSHPDSQAHEAALLEEGRGLEHAIRAMPETVDRVRPPTLPEMPPPEIGPDSPLVILVMPEVRQSWVRRLWGTLRRRHSTFDETRPTNPQSALATLLDGTGLSAPRARGWMKSRDPQASKFAEWVGILSRAQDCRDPRTRRELAERLLRQFEQMRDPEIREQNFAIATEAAQSCPDRAALGLNQMELAAINRRAQQGAMTPDELFDTGLAQFRLSNLEKWAMDHIRFMQEETPERANFIDEVEVILGLQVALRERLNLPVVSQSMLYHSGLEEHHIQGMGDIIEALENRPAGEALARYHEQLELLDGAAPLPLPRCRPAARFLAERFTPWSEHVARNTPQEVIEAHQARVADYVVRVDEALAENPEAMLPNQYRASMYVAQFFHQHGVAYEAALRFMIERQNQRVPV